MSTAADIANDATEPLIGAERIAFASALLTFEQCCARGEGPIEAINDYEGTFNARLRDAGLCRPCVSLRAVEDARCRACNIVLGSGDDFRAKLCLPCGMR